MSRPLLDETVLRFIDATLHIDGTITTKVVTKAFGLSRQKVSALFTQYRDQFPLNMSHDVKKKCYVRGNDFKANLLTTHSPEEYIKAVGVIFGEQGER